MEEVIAAFTEEVNKQRRDAEGARAAKDAEFAQVSRKLDGLIKAIAEGFRSETLQGKLTALEARRSELESELADAQPPPVRLHPNLSEIYRQKVEDLQVALRDETIRDEALDILRGLIDRVVMLPTDEGFGVELIGEIARMIEFSAGAENSQFDKYRSSVKVVAGARFGLLLLCTAKGLPPSLKLG